MGQLKHSAGPAEPLKHLLQPSPGTGPARTLQGRLVVFRKPLAANVPHHRVLGVLCCLEDILDQRTGPAGLQLHRQQVRRPQLTAQQVRLDLQERRTNRD